MTPYHRLGGRDGGRRRGCGGGGGQLALQQYGLIDVIRKNKHSIMPDESDPITNSVLRIRLLPYPERLSVVGQEQSVGVVLRRTKRQSKDRGERGRGKECSQSDHAREVTRVNRTRNNHDSMWKKKKGVGDESRARALAESRTGCTADRQALRGCIPLARGE